MDVSYLPKNPRLGWSEVQWVVRTPQKHDTDSESHVCLDVMKPLLFWGTHPMRDPLGELSSKLAV